MKLESDLFRLISIGAPRMNSSRKCATVIIPILLSLTNCIFHQEHNEDEHLRFFLVGYFMGKAHAPNKTTVIDHSPLITFTSSTTDPGAATTYNFTDINFGTPSPDRLIVVAFNGRNTTGISSASLGGVNATIVMEENRTNDYVQAMLAARVPDGTTGTVSVTCDTSADAGIISVFSLEGISSDSPVMTYNVGSNPLSATLNVDQNSSILAYAGNYRSGSGSWIWSGTAGLIEQSDISADSVMMHSTAILRTDSTLSGATVIATPDVLHNREGLFVTVWR